MAIKVHFTDEQIRSAAKKITDLKNHFTDDELHLLTNSMRLLINKRLTERYERFNPLSNGKNFKPQASAVSPNQPDATTPSQHQHPTKDLASDSPNALQAESEHTPFLETLPCADSDPLTEQAPTLEQQITQGLSHNTSTVSIPQ